MKHCVGLVSVGLCVLSLGCGSSAAGGGADSEGGSSAAGAAPTSGGAPDASAGASQGGGGASGSDTSLPSGGASDGGESVGGMAGATAGGAANSGGAAAVGGAAGQAGSGGAGGAGGAPGLDPNKPPGANFDLTRFTLQLPLADGDSVQQIKDLSTYTSDYFYTAPDGAMTFWCPVTGAHTPNTHYPRSELRENAVGGDWAISGTHSMMASFKVTKTPSSKGTIIGQVHGNATDGTSEILKLEWLTTNEIVASIEDNSSASQSDKGLGTYALNALLTYSIKLENSQLTVGITDATGATKSITTSYSASRWTKDSYYFKLGDYVQLDTGAATNGGRVSFYSFEIKHGT